MPHSAVVALWVLTCLAGTIPRALAAGVLLGALVFGAVVVLYAIRTDIADAAAALPRAMQRLGEWMGAGTVARQAERTVRSPDSAGPDGLPRRPDRRRLWCSLPTFC